MVVKLSKYGFTLVIRTPTRVNNSTYTEELNAIQGGLWVRPKLVVTVEMIANRNK